MAFIDDHSLVDRVIKSYLPDGPFMVMGPEQLEPIYRQFGIDPHSTDPTIFDMESLSHFLQAGVTTLFEQLRVEKQHHVLSVGEGNGAPSRLLAKMIGCRITCVDVSPIQLETARRCAAMHGVSHLLEFKEQNANRLDLGDSRFDRFYANESACHWENKEEAFRRIITHIKPGGLVGVNDWIRGSEGQLTDAETAVADFNGLYQHDVWRQISLEEMCRLLENSGCTIVSAEDVTEEVDGRLRKKLEKLETMTRLGARCGWHHEPTQRAVPYYRAMIATHFRFGRYGRVIARTN
jgi:cyclopropane fatty-acyl-phospholipid synthase-like methyltransferase